MSNGKNHIADKETLDEVNDKVGSSGDGISGTSLFAKINKLLGAVADHVAEWTSARAANIDNLDAAISGRAPANTALSNAVWTNTRAGYLDKLNSGVAVASLSGKIIKSVQRGTISLSLKDTNEASAKATINSINTAKAVIIGGNGVRAGGSDDTHRVEQVTLEITNGTTITAKCAGYGGTYSGTSYIPWQVIEFV